MTTTGFAVIGTGILGNLHAQVYDRYPDASLVAVCDTDIVRAQASAAKFGGVRIEDEVHCTEAAPENLTRDAFAEAAH